MKKSVLFSTLVFSSSLLAEGSFNVGGQWLWMEPSLSNGEFAREVTTSQGAELLSVEGKRKCYSLDSVSGYEVYAKYQSPTWDLRASYLDHCLSTRDKIHTSSPSFFVPLLGFVSDPVENPFLQSRYSLKLRHQEINGEVGWRFFEECSANFRLFAGAQYAELQKKLDLVFFDAPEARFQELESLSRIEEKNRLYGVGPRFGAHIFWEMICGFGLLSDFSLNLLFAKRKGSFFQETFDPQSGMGGISDFEWKEKFCRECALVPGVDLQVGLEWRFCYGRCFQFSVSGGYRVIHYWNAFDQFNVSGNSFTSSPSTQNRLIEASTWTSDDNYGLSGWFTGAAVCF